MQINQKKKEVRKNRVNPPQSYRHNVMHNKLGEVQDFKSHSLKNSQSIKRTKLQHDYIDEEQSSIGKDFSVNLPEYQISNSSAAKKDNDKFISIVENTDQQLIIQQSEDKISSVPHTPVLSQSPINSSKATYNTFSKNINQSIMNNNLKQKAGNQESTSSFIPVNDNTQTIKEINKLNGEYQE